MKSDNNGGSTDYYKINPKWNDLQDVIECNGLNFSQGNILKSAWCLNRNRHSGTSYERELNKIIWFCERELKRIESNGCIVSEYKPKINSELIDNFTIDSINTANIPTEKVMDYSPLFTEFKKPIDMANLPNPEDFLNVKKDEVKRTMNILQSKIKENMKVFDDLAKQKDKIIKEVKSEDTKSEVKPKTLLVEIDDNIMKLNGDRVEISDPLYLVIGCIEKDFSFIHNLLDRLKFNDKNITILYEGLNKVTIIYSKYNLRFEITKNDTKTYFINVLDTTKEAITWSYKRDYMHGKFATFAMYQDVRSNSETIKTMRAIMDENYTLTDKKDNDEF